MNRKTGINAIKRLLSFRCYSALLSNRQPQLLKYPTVADGSSLLAEIFNILEEDLKMVFSYNLSVHFFGCKTHVVKGV